MSIIYQALRKLEDNDSSQSSLRAENKEVHLSKPKSANRFFTKKTIPLLAASLTLAVLVFLLIFGRQYIAERISSLPFLVKKGSLSNSQFKLPLSLSGSNSEVTKPAGAYRLGGIIYDLEVPVVIINGKSLKEGDLIDTYQIGEITQSSVELVSTKDESQLILSVDF